MLRTLSRKTVGLFSSIWLGVTLLSLLFIYCSIGSSGVPTHPWIFNPASWVAVREMRPFELTEFEWFHWWPFDLLIALICVNLTVATIRRIPLNAINAGVWMIHGGIIILALGSVYYFSTKVEGDAPVVRRQVVIETPGGQTVSLPALPGKQASIVAADGRYSFRITSIDPQWELLSGEDQGERAYSVNLSVTTPRQQFIRQLIAGYPQYTEDLIRTSDQAQPFKRAVKETGTPLVDESLKIDLAYKPTDEFYLMQSRAIYLREAGREEWIMRPIDDLPRFNDYVASYDQVWISDADRDASGMPTIPIDPIDVTVPSVDPNDPLAGVPLHINAYLRYAFEESRRVPGGDRLDPVARVRLNSASGQIIEHNLAAFDPNSNTAQQGLLQFVWADTAASKEALLEVRDPLLRIRVPEAEVELDAAILDTTSANPDLEFTPIEGTDYAYRVTAIQDGLTVRAGVTDNVAIVEIRSPEQTFTRWVFDDPSLTRDLQGEQAMPAHGATAMIDEGIEMSYEPGQRSAPLTVIGGPGERELGVLLALEPGLTRFEALDVGQPLELASDVSLTVTAFHPFTTRQAKPAIVPVNQRDRDMGPNASLVRVQIPDGDVVQTEWLRFHQYAFDDPAEVLHRFLYQPKMIHLSDGRHIEVMFGRRKMPLPAAVALDDFVVDTHIGGFTGSTASIRDWMSQVTFLADGGWTEPIDVHMNSPKEHRGYWFFQAQWDPPDPPRFQGDVGSNGLNYTVLGVGNRNGVMIQLAGCCIAVIGMIYAFYIKPILKRRRQQAVYAQVAEQDAAEMEAAAKKERPVSEPVAVAMEEQA